MNNSNKKSILLLFFTFNIAYSQTVIKSPVSQYKQDMIKDGKLNTFNDKMLNILFADKVGTAFGGSNDLSLQKFFASLDAGENSISLGGNFDDRKDETQKLTWVLSSGLKLKAKDKFATFYKNGDFQESNIGAFFKVTFIGNGIIDYKDKIKGKKYIHRVKAIDAYREHLYSDYDNKALTLNKEESKIKSKQEDLIKYSTEAESTQALFDKKRKESRTLIGKLAPKQWMF